MHIWDAARGTRLCTVEDVAGPDGRQGYCGRLVGWVGTACLVRGWAPQARGAAAWEDGEDDEWPWEHVPGAHQGRRHAAAASAGALPEPLSETLEAIVATGGGDEAIRLWRLELSAEGAVAVAAACPPAKGHTDAVRRVRAVNAAGTRLLSCSMDGTVRAPLRPLSPPAPEEYDEPSAMMLRHHDNRLPAARVRRSECGT